LTQQLANPHPARHRVGEPRQRRRQLLEVRAGNAGQLPLQHAADGGLLLFCPILQHVDVMPRQPDAQLRAPDRLRQDAVRIVPERLLDDVQRPDLQRLGHHLRPRKPLPERCRPQLHIPRLDGVGHLPLRPPEESRRFPNLLTVLRLAVALECKVTDFVRVFDKTDLPSILPK
jgi:hypothetical protein